jgi:hypothetical protein
MGRGRSVKFRGKGNGAWKGRPDARRDIQGVCFDPRRSRQVIGRSPRAVSTEPTLLDLKDRGEGLCPGMIWGARVKPATVAHIPQTRNRRQVAVVRGPEGCPKITTTRSGLVLAPPMHDAPPQSPGSLIAGAKFVSEGGSGSRCDQ